MTRELERITPGIVMVLWLCAQMPARIGGMHAGQLASLIFPAGLTNLTELSLYNNQLTNFSFLVGLTNLPQLDLSFNQLTSLSLPEGLSALTNLNLNFNELADLSLPRDLTGLSILSLENNHLTKLSFLVALTNLTVLDLGNNPSKGIQGILVVDEAFAAKNDAAVGKTVRALVEATNHLNSNPAEFAEGALGEVRLVPDDPARRRNVDTPHPGVPRARLARTHHDTAARKLPRLHDAERRRERRDTHRR